MSYGFYFFLLGSYFLGSLSPSILISRFIFNKDIRTLGSGNAGATNTFRNLGKKWGAMVLCLDILKGALPIIALSFFDFDNPNLSLLEEKNLVGLGVMLGHIFPILHKFKGGKGVATLFGVFVATYFDITLLAFLLFFLVLYFTHFVSLGSILAVFLFSTYLLLLHKGEWHFWQILLSLSYSIIVLWTHRSNVNRLVQGKENKIFLFKKKAK